MLGYGTSCLPQRHQRPGMAILGTLVATAQTGRTAYHLPPEGDHQRHPLRSAHRLLLANVAPRPAALAHRLPLLPHLASRRNLATGPQRPARHAATSSGPPSQSQRGGHRQPVGQDHGKRGPRGYDAGKRVSGRKRHIVVDTLGLLLAVVVHPADVQDRDGARLVLARLLGRFPRLQLIWADGAYGGKLVKWAKTMGGWTLELVRRPAQQRTFQVLPRRWVVERTFGWLNLQRRLSKDYESLCETTEAWIHISMTGLMLKRLARHPSF